MSLEAWVTLETLDELAEAIGLRWQARSTFVWGWHKIPLTLAVHEDGTTALLTCAGQGVGEKGGTTA